jgi:peptidoglycan/LPS O-acetylase OafA/YrhL
MLENKGLHVAARFIGNGSLAVVLFFVLSGLILAYTYQGQIETSNNRRHFWEARFARIWPLYFVSLLLSSAIIHKTPTFPHALAVLFMVQSWDPWNIGMASAWNGVCWTLSVEALFYVTFPFFQVWIEKQRPRTQTVLVFAMLTSMILTQSCLHGIGTPINGLYRFLPLAVIHIPEFLVGVCLGNLILSRRNLTGTKFRPLFRRFPGGVWTASAAAVTILLLCLPSGAATAAAVVGFASLLFGLASERSFLERLLSSRPLLIGGQISYGIYLLQWPCKAMVNRACDHMEIYSMPIRFSIDTFLLVIVSVFTFYMIENPSRRIIRHLFSQIEQGRGESLGLVRSSQL